MKQFVITMVLACALSSSALAGNIPSDGSPSPAPNPAPTTSTSPGDIPCDGMSAQVSGDALSAILSVLSFLTR